MDIPRNLDAPLPEAVRLWLIQNPTVSNILSDYGVPENQIFSYKRSDITRATPYAIDVYPINITKEQDPNRHYGALQVDILYSTKAQRNNMVQTALNIQANILQQMRQQVDGTEPFIDFLNQYVGGLAMLGLTSDSNFTPLYTNDNQETQLFRLGITMEYWINWSVYRNWLLSFRCDIQSPNVPIYDYLEAFQYTIKLL